MRADIQSHRHTDTLIAVLRTPPLGEVITAQSVRAERSVVTESVVCDLTSDIYSHRLSNDPFSLPIGRLQQ